MMLLFIIRVGALYYRSSPRWDVRDSGASLRR